MFQRITGATIADKSLEHSKSQGDAPPAAPGDQDLKSGDTVFGKRKTPAVKKRTGGGKSELHGRK